MHLYNSNIVYGSFCNITSAIKLFYKLNGFELLMSDIHVQLLMKAAKRNLSASSKPKAPIEVPHLLYIISHANYKDPQQHAFVAAVLTAFFGCLRRSNTVPPSASAFNPAKHLTRRAVVFQHDAIVLTLPWTKTLQDQRDIFTVTIAKSSDCVIDPVGIIQTFITTYPAQPLDPAFSYYVDGVRHMLTQSMLDRLLKSNLQAMGVPAAAYGSHSLRRGGTTLIYSSNVAPELIRAHGTWKSMSYTKYIHLSHKQKKLPTQSMYRSINAMLSNC